MFLLELRFFVFHLPRIKLKKKDRVFGSDRKWRFCVSCFAASSRNLRRPLGWHFLRHIISCDLISCKVDKSTPFLCLWHFEARSRLWCSTDRFISGVFTLFKFLSCLYIVPLPKIFASRLVTNLGYALYMGKYGKLKNVEMIKIVLAGYGIVLKMLENLQKILRNHWSGVLLKNNPKHFRKSLGNFEKSLESVQKCSKLYFDLWY